MLPLMAFVTGAASCGSPAPLSEPNRALVEELAEARSAFAVVHSGARQLVVRYELGTWVVDDVDAAFRIVHRDGQTWFAAGGERMRRMPAWDSIFRRIGNLGRVLSPRRVADNDEGLIEVRGLPWRVTVEPDRHGLRVEVRQSEDDRLMPLPLPGVGHLNHLGGCVGPGHAGPMYTRFQASYLQLDVPLEPGWSDIQPPALPPAPRAVCGFRLVGGLATRWRDCDWRDHSDHPVPAHEIATELWFAGGVGPSGRPRHQVNVPATCTPPTAPPPLRPYLEGVPWRDLQRARALGCPVRLVARPQIGPVLEEGTVGQGTLAATYADGAARRVLGQTVIPEDAAPMVQRRHRMQPVSIDLPADLDLSRIEVNWDNEASHACADDRRPPAGGEVRVQALFEWDCPELGAPRVPVPHKRRRW